MNRKAIVINLVTTAVLVAGSLLLWHSKQAIVDAVNYYQYTPTSDVKSIASEAGMTDDAIFTFYATRPEIDGSKTFNQRCTRKEADSPILGCYSANRIFIFDITDERLKGIKTVTAAHEMLHAEYDRMPSPDKERVNKLLNDAYAKIADDDLRKRMAYYDKTEPGQNANELHSIIGTEYSDIGPELEAYYKTYFTDRQKLVQLHEKVDGVFSGLSKEAATLVSRIETLVDSINGRTRQYNSEVQQLNRDVEAFNQRARQSGGFSSQAEFEQAQANLSSRSDALQILKSQIERDIVTYRSLLSQLDAINSESASLNKSLDSTLTNVPEV